MAFDEGWITRPDGTVHVAVVDSETTGLDTEADEVIGLGILCVRVDRHRGRMLGVVGSAFEWQEPKVYTEAAQTLTQIPPRSLAGRRIDRSKIDALLAQTDLVVAHNAAFKRPFLEPLLPALSTLRWACSLADIDWQVGQGVPHPSIDMLLKIYSMGPTDKTPEGDCHALVRILTQPLPLPQSSETGFHRLIVESARVTVECVIPDSEQVAQAGLEALGFGRQGSRWFAGREDAAGAHALEMRVIDLAAGNPAFAQLKMWRVDAISRHGYPVAMSPPP
ncbi:putative DNA polymerase III subunit epsilon [Rubrivivax sp. A210]|uniref:hypothetical protein n=1 Tax=Rubrivivax sp. A210 TaxID=2772301 RepID=UPI00191B1F3C|nr:hypothetical protein [Rubrivivax sp. A210]CAD5372912.1 putative DNA polymerase III subunit epsilon [Rubrivivax sp. A210]